MQLMPAVARENGVTDPFASRNRSAPARSCCSRDWSRATTAITRARPRPTTRASAQWRSTAVPPLPETLEYVDKVTALHARYRAAMGLKPLQVGLRAAE